MRFFLTVASRGTRLPHRLRVGASRAACSVVIALSVISVSLSVTLSVTAEARGLLRVRADSEMSGVGAIPTDTSVDVSGTLRDDTGQPIAGARVVVTATRDEAVAASACRSGDTVVAEPDGVVMRTDPGGFFCARLPRTASLAGRVVRYDGDTYHGTVTATISSDVGRRPIGLAFEDRELTASLDAPSVVIRVTTRIVEGGGSPEPVRLVLSFRPRTEGGPESEVGATDVELGSTAKFDIESRLLAPPGVGKLVVRFAGSSSLAKAEEWVLLERHATAHLGIATTLSPSDPTDGVELAVAVGWAAGAVPNGWVEALLDGQPVGVAEVSAGASRVVATFAPPRGRPAQIALRYIADGDGFVAGAPLVVDVPVRPPNPWTGLPWLLAAIGIAYWVVRAWRRPVRSPRAPTRPGDATSGRASVELVERDASQSGWKGRVLDAHDGTPIALARLKIVVPVFDGEGVAASFTTGADGTFAIAHVASARNEGARLVVAAPHHSTLEKQAPSDGVLVVNLVSRRRAILDRLVGWTREAGRPWSRKKEPTPQEVSALARGARHGDVLAWAAAVEEAAYGPASPDERREAEIIAKEPSPSRHDGGRDER